MLKRGGEALSDFFDLKPGMDDQTLIDTSYFMGLILFKLKLIPKAKEYFEKVINVDPNHSNAKYYLKQIK
jgi:tetratricopeptide (TPR) repeat protein